MTLLSRGVPIARIVPMPRHKKPYFTRDEFLAIPKLDAAFRDELKALRADDADDAVGADDADPYRR